MIEKLLTLLSGNILLTKKSIEAGNKTLTERLESSQKMTDEAFNKLSENLAGMSNSIQMLAKAIEEREDKEIEIPEIEIPDIKFPEIPTPQVTVNVPEIKIPKADAPIINVQPPVVNVEPNITVTPTPVTFPSEMSVTGLSAWFQKVIDLLSKDKKETVYSAKNPLPVAFIDRQGRQYDLIHLGTPRAMAGGATPSEITGADKTLRTVSFDLSATGVVVPAVTGRRIKVYAIKLTTDAPLSVGFRDGASTLLEGMQDYLANSGYIDNIQPPAFLMATSAGEALQLAITGTGNVSGRVSYWSDDKV